MLKKTLDEYDKSIIRQLILNPRQSDNSLAKTTGIPLRTVNRRRRRLESSGLLCYYASVNNGPEGTGVFGATALYLIRFRHGIFRKQVLEGIRQLPVGMAETKHISCSALGEQEGHVVLLIYIESRQFQDILEIFNVEIVGKIKALLGPDAIEHTMTLPITETISLLHNYSALLNMKNGRIMPDWPQEKIFVSE